MSLSSVPSQPRPQVPPRLRVSIVAALAAGFIAVALISAIAFGITVLGAADATQRLLLDRNRAVVDAGVRQLSASLDAIGWRLEYIAGLAASGRLDTNSPSAMQDAIAIALQALPQVAAMAFASPDEKVHTVRRGGSRLVRESQPLSELPAARERYRKLQQAQAIFWGDLFWSQQLGQPVLNVRVPIRATDGSFVGGLVANVTLGGLSHSLINANGATSEAAPQLAEGTSFILVGRERVLAHHRLLDAAGLALGEDHPLPNLQELGDPVLAAIWSPPVRASGMERALAQIGHVVTVDGRRWVFVWRSVQAYGQEPWTVGHYFPLEVARRDLERLRAGVAAAGGALAFALLLAAVMGLRMARTVRGLGRSAEALERLDFEAAPCDRSYLREFDEAATAMARAQHALRWFGRYVPRSLVRRLMAEGEGALASQRRVVTVMFTDIVGFTPQAEEMDEIGSADLLNQHFALIGAVIDRHDGMIDKFIGDAVMAVWGAIRPMQGHADAACRAAVEIAGVLQEDNQRRRELGLAAIRLRIGLHTGPVTVGNIGAPGRINFTVVGDTVNVAQRLEQLGKQHMDEGEEVIVLASGATLAALQDPKAAGGRPSFVGEQIIRGRTEPERIYRLL
jgi:adenylate cyclase